MLLVLGLPSCDTIWHNARLFLILAVLLTIGLLVYFLEISFHFFFLLFIFNIYYYFIISYSIFFYCDMDPCGLMQID